MISVLSDNKALKHNKLIITTSEVGSRKFLIAHKGSITVFFFFFVISALVNWLSGLLI